MASDEESNENKDVFEVLVLLEADYQKGKYEDELGNKRRKWGWHYRVRWWGYSSDADTFEPHWNIYNKDTIKRFWAGLGLTEKEADKDVLYYAKGEWISKQIREFEKSKDSEEGFGPNDQSNAKATAKAKAKLQSDKEDTPPVPKKKRGRPRKSDKDKGKGKATETPPEPQSGPSKLAHRDSKGAFDFDDASEPEERPARAARKRKKLRISDDEEEGNSSEDTTPLAVLGGKLTDQRGRTQSADGSVASHDRDVASRLEQVSVGSRSSKPTSQSPAPALRLSEVISAKSKSPTTLSKSTAAATTVPPKASSTVPKPPRPARSQSDLPPPSKTRPTIVTSVLSATGPASAAAGPSSSSAGPSSTKSALPLPSARPKPNPTNTGSVPGYNKHRGSKVGYLPDTAGLPVPPPEQGKVRFKTKTGKLITVPPKHVPASMPTQKPSENEATTSMSPPSTVAITTEDPLASIVSDVDNSFAGTATSSNLPVSAQSSRGRGDPVKRFRGGKQVVVPLRITKPPTSSTPADPSAPSSGPAITSKSSGGWSASTGSVDQGWGAAFEPATGDEALGRSSTWLGSATVAQSPPSTVEKVIEVIEMEVDADPLTGPQTMDVDKADDFLSSMFTDTPIVGDSQGWSGTIQLCTTTDVIPIPAQFENVTALPGSQPIKDILHDQPILFERMYPVPAVKKGILPAFGRPTHLGIVKAKQASDLLRLSKLTALMKDNHYLSVAHLRTATGRLRDLSIIMFPAAKCPFDIANVPPSFITFPQQAMAIAVVKQIHTSAFKLDNTLVGTAALFRPPPASKGQDTSMDVDELSIALDPEQPAPMEPWPPGSENQHALEDRQTIATLGITADQMKKMHAASYCLFPDTEEQYLDPEGRALSKLLSRTVKAKRVATGDSRARFVFIHNRGRERLATLPKLLERRRAFPQVGFYMYGWDLLTDPAKSALESVWEIGGILTFTPRALLESPDLVLEILEETQNDTFWQVYTNPSVLALADELAAVDDLDHVSVLCTIARLVRGCNGLGGTTIGLPESSPSLFDWVVDQMGYWERPLADILKDFRQKLKDTQQATAKGIKANRDQIEPPVSTLKPVQEDGWAGARAGDVDGWGNSAGSWGNVDNAGRAIEGATDDPWGSETAAQAWGSNVTAVARTSTRTTTSWTSPDIKPEKSQNGYIKSLPEVERRIVEASVEADLIAEMTSMQFHPQLCKYRRFVVITADSEKKMDGELVEFTTLRQFRLLPPQPSPS